MICPGTYATSRRGGVSAMDVEKAKADIGPRATVSMIARHLGRCEADIRAILEAREIRAEPSEEELQRQAERRERERLAKLDRQFATMWTAGVSLERIQETFGISKSKIQGWRTRLRLEPRVKYSVPKEVPWPPEKDAILRREYLVAGKPMSTVAKMLGVTRNSAIGRAHRLGFIRQHPADIGADDQQEAA